MRLEQLNYVVTIADCRSISKAAQKLYITQPALSNALRDLAKEDILSLEQLRDVPIICFENYEASETRGYGIRAAYTFIDRASIKDAVFHGKGCALLPVSMALDDVYFECDKIKVVPLKETFLIHVDMVYRRSKSMTEEETAILEIIRSYIRKADARLNRQFLKNRNQTAGSSIWLPY